MGRIFCGVGSMTLCRDSLCMYGVIVRYHKRKGKEGERSKTGDDGRMISCHIKSKYDVFNY
jgi:hypothetical protein